MSLFMKQKQEFGQNFSKLIPRGLRLGVSLTFFLAKSRCINKMIKSEASEALSLRIGILFNMHSAGGKYFRRLAAAVMVILTSPYISTYRPDPVQSHKCHAPNLVTIPPMLNLEGFNLPFKFRHKCDNSSNFLTSNKAI